MLNDIDFFKCNVQTDAAVDDCLQIFGEKQPYSLEHTLRGTRVVFSEDFLTKCRIALTTQCVAAMSNAEEALYKRWLDGMQNGSYARDITSDTTVELAQLDSTLVQLFKHEDIYKVNECWDTTSTAEM